MAKGQNTQCNFKWSALFGFEWTQNYYNFNCKIGPFDEESFKDTYTGPLKVGIYSVFRYDTSMLMYSLTQVVVQQHL